jgi:hypothetical protein
MSRYFELVTGDRLPYLEKTLYDGSNQPEDLTNATVRWRMEHFETGVLVTDAPATIVVPGTAGTVRYDWTAADALLPAGRYRGRFRGTTAGGLPFSVPSGPYIDIMIYEDVGDFAVLNPDAAPAQITLTADRTDLFLGDTQGLGASAQLTATPQDAGGTPISLAPVTYTSSDPTIATVSPTGVVVPVSEGSVTITAASTAAPSVQASLAFVVAVSVPLTLLWNIPQDRLKPRIYQASYPPDYQLWNAGESTEGAHHDARWMKSRTLRKWVRQGGYRTGHNFFTENVAQYAGAVAYPEAQREAGPWPGRTDTEHAAYRITFPVFDATAAAERANVGGANTRYKGPALRVTCSSGISLITEKVDQRWARIWTKNRAGTGLRKLLVSFYQGETDDGTNVDVMAHDYELTFDNNWVAHEVGPIILPGGPAAATFKMLIWGVQNAERIVDGLIRVTMHGGSPLPTGGAVGDSYKDHETNVPIHDEYGLIVYPGSRNFARGGGGPVGGTPGTNYTELGNSVPVYGSANGGHAKTSIPAPDAEDWPAGTGHMTHVRFGPALGENWIGTDNFGTPWPVKQTDVPEMHLGAPTTPTNSIYYVWVTLTIEADESGYLPADGDFRARVYQVGNPYGGDHIAPMQWTPYRPHACPDRNGVFDGCRLYAARVFIGRDAYWQRFTDVQVRIENTTGVARSFYAYAFGWLPEAFNSFRDFGYLPAAIPSRSVRMDLAENTPVTLRGLKKSGPHMMYIRDLTQYLTTAQGFIAWQLAPPVDPQAIMDESIARGISNAAGDTVDSAVANTGLRAGVALAWSDSGPQATPAYMLYAYFTGQGGTPAGKAHLTLQLSNGDLQDPTVGTLGPYVQDAARLEIDTGHFPAWQEFVCVMRWKNCMIQDFHVVASGINGGVGRWYLPDGTVSPGLADPPLRTSLARQWDWGSAAMQSTYPGYMAHLTVGSERDVDNHFKGPIRHMALGKTYPSRRFIESLARSTFGARMNWMTRLPL